MKLKRSLIVFGAFLICMVNAILAPSVFAASASASVSGSPSIGKTVTVTVSFRDTNIGAVSGTFSYDSSALSYTSGTNTSNGRIAAVASSPGASSISVSMNFTVLKAGTHTVSISGSEILDFDGNSLGSAGTSAKVVVSAPTTPKPTTPKPTTPTPTTPVVPEVNPMDKAVEVTIGEAKWYLWPELINVTLPAGFEKGESKYKESPIQVGQRQQVLLAYLTDGEGKNGTFWTYNAQTQEFYPYVAIQSSNSYVLLQPGTDVALPEGYETTTTFELDGRTINGWKSDDEAIQDFVLVYAMNSEGKEGFYYYDLQEKTMQRFGQRIVEVEVIDEPEPEPIIRQIFGNPILAGIFSGLGLLAAGLAAGLIRTVQKYKNR